MRDVPSVLFAVGRNGGFPREYYPNSRCESEGPLERDPSEYLDLRKATLAGAQKRLAYDRVSRRANRKWKAKEVWHGVLLAANPAEVLVTPGVK